MPVGRKGWKRKGEQKKRLVKFELAKKGKKKLSSGIKDFMGEKRRSGGRIQRKQAMKITHFGMSRKKTKGRRKKKGNKDPMRPAKDLRAKPCYSYLQNPEGQGGGGWIRKTPAPKKQKHKTHFNTNRRGHP